MKAMVLAAGFGERMKPLTWNRAKPALPLLNRPSVLHLLEHLARSGISQVILNLHYRPDTLRALEPSIKELGLRVGFSEEAVILGTGGGLKNAEAFLADGTFLMVNSDFVTDCPILLALEHHRQSQALATLILTPYREGTEYGAVEMGEDIACETPWNEWNGSATGTSVRRDRGRGAMGTVACGNRITLRSSHPTG